jgi:hypothetical protein
VLFLLTEGYPPPPWGLEESSRWQEIPRKIRMSKNLDTKIRTTKDLGARRYGFTRPSLPRL